MPSLKRFVIVNPNAGAGRGGKDWPRIKQILLDSGIEFDYEIKIRRFHAMIITRRKIREGYRKFIIVGGDGTLNETINGIFAQKELEPTEITIGMIPVGTGNDWSRMFGIWSSTRTASFSQSQSGQSCRHLIAVGGH
jgi:diacylglycerol kinase family enzyme